MATTIDFNELFQSDHYYNSFTNEKFLVTVDKFDGESMEEFSIRMYKTPKYWIFPLLCGNGLTNIFEDWDNLEVVKTIQPDSVSNYLLSKQI